MSGGFYRYRCKYFYTHNCPNWVWVNGAPCATCLAEGRDAVDDVSGPVWRAPGQVCIPTISEGVIQYTMMDVVVTGDAGLYWQLRLSAGQLLPNVPATTSDTPSAVTATASGLASSQLGY